MKKHINGIFFVVTLLLIPIIVYAADGGSISNFSLSSGGTKRSSKYNFTGNNHYVSYGVDNLKDSSKTQKVVIAAYKNSNTGTNYAVRKTVNAAYHTQVYANMGEVGKGYYTYGFGAYQNAFTSSSSTGTVYAGFESEIVTFYSI